MFTGKNKVRMHDTDMAGILYFARQFRFAHDALEDFVENEGFDFHKVFHEENFVFVIVHCESDYYSSLKVGDPLTVQVFVEQLGNSSFTMLYEIYREVNDGHSNDKKNHEHVGSAKTVHVTLDRISRKKIPVPEKFRESLEKHLISK